MRRIMSAHHGRDIMHGVCQKSQCRQLEKLGGKFIGLMGRPVPSRKVFQPSRKALLPGPFEAMRNRQDAWMRRQKLDEGIQQRRPTATPPSSLPFKHTRTVAPAEPKEGRPGSRLAAGLRQFAEVGKTYIKRDRHLVSNE